MAAYLPVEFHQHASELGRTIYFLSKQATAPLGQTADLTAHRSLDLRNQRYAFAIKHRRLVDASTDSARFIRADRRGGDAADQGRHFQLTVMSGRFIFWRASHRFSLRLVHSSESLAHCAITPCLTGGAGNFQVSRRSGCDWAGCGGGYASRFGETTPYKFRSRPRIASKSET